MVGKEKAMATHSSTLAWQIPWMGEPGGLLSLGSQSRTRLKRLSSSSSMVGKGTENRHSDSWVYCREEQVSINKYIDVGLKTRFSL